MLGTCEGNQVFSENELKFAAAVNLKKCLKQIELPIFSARTHLLLSYRLIYVPWLTVEGYKSKSHKTALSLSIKKEHTF